MCKWRFQRSLSPDNDGMKVSRRVWLALCPNFYRTLHVLILIVEQYSVPVRNFKWPSSFFFLQFWNWKVKWCRWCTGSKRKIASGSGCELQLLHSSTRTQMKWSTSSAQTACQSKEVKVKGTLVGCPSSPNLNFTTSSFFFAGHCIPMMRIPLATVETSKLPTSRDWISAYRGEIMFIRTWSQRHISTVSEFV